MKSVERPQSARKWIAVLSCGLLIVSLLMICLAPARVPPSVSIAHVGYTNGIGPYALLAITNRSDYAIALEPICWVQYASTQSAPPHRVTSVEPSTLNVTRLPSHEGFVQKVFVFPAGQGEWQFECAAAYSSSWLEVRRYGENLVRKLLKRGGSPKATYRFPTEWQPCP